MFVLGSDVYKILGWTESADDNGRALSGCIVSLKLGTCTSVQKLMTTTGVTKRSVYQGKIKDATKYTGNPTFLNCELREYSKSKLSIIEDCPQGAIDGMISALGGTLSPPELQAIEFCDWELFKSNTSAHGSYIRKRAERLAKEAKRKSEGKTGVPAAGVSRKKQKLGSQGVQKGILSYFSSSSAQREQSS